jgi:superfamily I DNA/RNA helicase
MQLYRGLLDNKRYLDFTAIMEHALRVLREDPAVRQRLAARVRHVVVDEYQDVNPLQERLVQGLVRFGAWLCVVGDDDQTIYQWNGADVRNILEFERRYPGVRTVRLQENFRSTNAIVEVARDFIAQNAARLPKAMIPTNAQPTEANDLATIGFKDPDDEAAYIARTIKSLRGTAFTEGADHPRALVVGLRDPDPVGASSHGRADREGAQRGEDPLRHPGHEHPLRHAGGQRGEGPVLLHGRPRERRRRRAGELLAQRRPRPR